MYGSEKVKACAAELLVSICFIHLTLTARGSTLVVKI